MCDTRGKHRCPCVTERTQMAQYGQYWKKGLAQPQCNYHLCEGILLHNGGMKCLLGPWVLSERVLLIDSGDG